ncbi:MAG: hypothetical protein HY253_07275 [Burkholderiales bacterium]|nr:hypothetical protein [Burkholderiales bacterium]
MWLLAVEALGAFFLFVLIVWWTMYSGKKPAHTKKKSDTKKETDPN